MSIHDEGYRSADAPLMETFFAGEEKPLGVGDRVGALLEFLALSAFLGGIWAVIEAIR